MHFTFSFNSNDHQLKLILSLRINFKHFKVN